MDFKYGVKYLRNWQGGGPVYSGSVKYIWFMLYSAINAFKYSVWGNRGIVVGSPTLSQEREGNLPRTASEPHFIYMQYCASLQGFRSSPKQSSGDVLTFYLKQD